MRSITTLAAMALGAGLAMVPGPAITWIGRGGFNAPPPLSRPHARTPKNRDTKRYGGGRYKGSAAAKRATRRGGNPAAQR